LHSIAATLPLPPPLVAIACASQELRSSRKIENFFFAAVVDLRPKKKRGKVASEFRRVKLPRDASDACLARAP
jgi:hypothetical protein